jgi:alpha-tubulin suppressor-like RCC1 family protein
VVKAGGDLWVWGHNASEQLGRDLDRFIFRPVQNCDIEGVLSVTGRTSHSIALKENGTVWTWGEDEEGQLGDRSVEGGAKPVKVAIR